MSALKFDWSNPFGYHLKRVAGCHCRLSKAVKGPIDTVYRMTKLRRKSFATEERDNCVCHRTSPSIVGDSLAGVWVGRSD